MAPSELSAPMMPRTGARSSGDPLPDVVHIGGGKRIGEGGQRFEVGLRDDGAHGGGRGCRRAGPLGLRKGTPVPADLRDVGVGVPDNRRSRLLPVRGRGLHVDAGAPVGLQDEAPLLDEAAGPRQVLRGRVLQDLQAIAAFAGLFCF